MAKLVVLASIAALRDAIASPEGVAAAAATPNFATGGVEMLIYATKDL